MNNNRFVKLLSLYFLVSSLSFAEELYVISGNPFTLGTVQFSTKLFKISDGGYVTQHILSEGRGQNSNVNTQFVKTYLAKKLVVECEYNYDNNELLLNLIDYNDNFEYKQIVVPKPDNYYYISSQMIDNPTSGLQYYFKLGRFNSQLYYLHKVYDFKTGRFINVRDPLLQYTLFEGFEGGFIGSSEPLFIRISESGQLISYVEGPSLFDTFDISFDSTQMKYKDNKFLLLVSNDHYLVMSSLDLATQSTTGLGQSEIFVYDKQKHTWKSIILPGGYPIIRGFGHWIGGNTTDIKGDRQNVLRRSDYYIKDTGFPTSEKMNDSEIYSHGIIFLYDLQNDTYIEYDTGESDCEVLLIENEVLYYRLFDTIYKAEIQNGSLLDPILLSSGPAITDAHWAFIK